MVVNFLDKTGTLYFLTKIKDYLGINYVAKESGKGLSSEDYTTAEKTKLSGIESGAQVNVIESISVNGTQAQITGKQAEVNIDSGLIDSISVNGVTQTIDANKNVNISVPTNNNQLDNGANYQNATQVATAINERLSAVYKPKGSIAFANLPTLDAEHEGFVYNVTDAFTTTTDFVEGAGKSYPSGTNVVIVNISENTYKYDVLAGFMDMSGYVATTDLVPITDAEIDAMFS